MNLGEKLYSILIEGGSWKTILNGLWVTVKISALALLLGTALGALVCLLRTRKNALPRRLAQAYIAVLRGTPVLMLLLLMFYGILARYGFSPVTVAIITFGLNVSSHVAELLRAAWEASDKGQAEAARTLSLTAWEAFRWVTLPQMLRTARPVFSIHHREPDPVDQRGGLHHHHRPDPRHQQHRLPHHAATADHNHRHADLSGAELPGVWPVRADGAQERGRREMSLIEVRGLKKRFGAQEGLKGIDLTIEQGERKRGGLGIFMAKQYMDDITYQYKDGQNILTLRKRL